MFFLKVQLVVENYLCVDTRCVIFLMYTCTLRDGRYVTLSMLCSQTFIVISIAVRSSMSGITFDLMMYSLGWNDC